MHAEAENRGLIAYLKHAVRLASNAEITRLDHLPVDVIVEGILVVLKALFFTSPKIGPEAEGQRSGLRVATVVKEIIIQQRHRLDVSAVHDIISTDGIPFLAVFLREMSVKDASTAADV